MSNVATIARQLCQTYWLNEWMGPDLDQRTYCPGVVFGLTFNYESDDDCAPFTASEVKASRGWVRLTIEEVDRWRGGVTSGLEMVDGEQRFVSEHYRLLNLQFAIRTPADSDLAIGEGYADALEAIFDGVTIPHPGPPFVRLRNLGKYPTRRRGPLQDAPWRVLFLDVKILSRERRPHRGVQEVSL